VRQHQDEAEGSGAIDRERGGVAETQRYPGRHYQGVDDGGGGRGRLAWVDAVVPAQQLLGQREVDVGIVERVDQASVGERKARGLDGREDQDTGSHRARRRAAPPFGFDVGAYDARAGGQSARGAPEAVRSHDTERVAAAGDARRGRNMAQVPAGHCAIPRRSGDAGKRLRGPASSLAPRPEA
jgi:hypothetical protein